jgi:cell division protein FtsN
MSRDYKPGKPRTASRGSPFFTGLLIGLLLGVGASLGLTMYLKGKDSPFAAQKAIKPNEEIIAEKIASKKKQNDEKAQQKAEAAKSNTENSADKKADNQFDFYTILPETESTVTEQEVREKAKTVKKDNYFLQVGAFPDEADADNMKAKLALLGFEALVQTATIPEKGVYHRVRVGPLGDIDKINKIRGELNDNGFNTDLIKVHTETKPE